MESIHNKLSRVRKPRVHITYDVETEGALVKKELPFVVGVMGDFSGNNNADVKPLKDRRFIQIDRDNFDRSEEHTSELQSRPHLVCRLLLEKKKDKIIDRL